MSAPRLLRMEGWPDGLAALEPRDIRTVFPEPTLIAIAGRRPEPLFVSVLLHGNETVGLGVLKELAARHRDEPPPRGLLIFVGNVAAVEAGVRFLPDQPDYNRIWAGPSAQGESPEHALAAEVLAAARAAAPFASIDVHNNTGRNPLYGCVHTLDPANLSLAALFSRIGVLYDTPPTTQSIAFTPLCPAITIECGRAGVAANEERAAQFVLDVLRLSEIDTRPAAYADLTLHHTLGRILVDPDVAVRFGEDPGDEAALRLPADFDLANFSRLPEGWPFARVEGGAAAPIKVVDAADADLTASFFTREADVLRLTRPVIPAMLTTDLTIMRQDCLGYFMEPLAPSAAGPG